MEFFMRNDVDEMCEKTYYMRFREHRNENGSFQFKVQIATGWVEEKYCFQSILCFIGKIVNNKP